MSVRIFRSTSLLLSVTFIVLFGIVPCGYAAETTYNKSIEEINREAARAALWKAADCGAGLDSGSNCTLAETALAIANAQGPTESVSITADKGSLILKRQIQFPGR